MSGIGLLLETAIDYERTHQLALYTLFSKSTLPLQLVNTEIVKKVIWEPEGQLFDLAVVDQDRTVYFELKMWSWLSENQRKRQETFLAEKKSLGFYILLGTSWFEFSSKNISDGSSGAAAKIGYEELITALNRLMVSPNESPDVYELALAYRNSLQEQFNKISTAYSRNENEKLFFYSLYSEVQKKVSGMETSIYTVNNPGGPVYILNNSEYWKPFTCKLLSGKLFYEVVNGRLCIKFYSENSDSDKYILRDRIRKAVRKVLGGKYDIVDAGRLGAYMTACQIDYDFKKVAQIDVSASIFQSVAEEFDNIVKAI